MKYLLFLLLPLSAYAQQEPFIQDGCVGHIGYKCYARASVVVLPDGIPVFSSGSNTLDVYDKNTHTKYSFDCIKNQQEVPWTKSTDVSYICQ